MGRVSCLALIACLLVLCAVSAGFAEEGESRYGAGMFFDRSVPILGLGDRYPASQKYGLVFEYKLSSRTTMEFEYHHAKLTEGKIEGRAFTWGIDKKKYLSPDAQSSLNLNGFLINALVRLGQPSGSDMQLAPYIAVGAGFYDYQDRISGMIYPGQKVEPLDADLLIEPREDEHTALGANFGMGMAVVQGRFGLDVRARYHLILGDLRPMKAWDLETVFPMGLLDVRTTFKIYFQ